jgi:hypothetical protein
MEVSDEMKESRIQIRVGDAVAVIMFCKCMIWHLSGLTWTSNTLWKQYEKVQSCYNAVNMVEEVSGERISDVVTLD